MPFEVPEGDDRAARLGSVLEVIYLIFNEGYSATAGRRLAAARAVRRGAAARAPAGRAGARRARGARAARADGDPVARAAAPRSGRDGEPVLLLDQDRRTWDRLLINRGLAALGRARARSRRRRARTRCRPRSPPATPARPTPRTPTGPQMVALYDAARARSCRRRSSSSTARSPSRWPSGPTPALDLVDQLRRRAALERLPPAPQRPRRPAVTARPPRGGRAEFELAASLARND